MGHYNVYLPNYSIGADCYKEIPHVARNYGNKVVVIGGKTAMAKAKPELEKALAGSEIEILDYIWFGGDSSYENGDALIANPTVQAADIIFGVGGGRACDTTKYVADKLDKALFTFPTLGSNCASVTAICVMYNPDGTFKDYYYPKLANHTFINSAIVADSPEQLLWAGIGDALSKECEAVFSSRGLALDHTPLMGVQLSKVCTTPLLENGELAMEAVRKKEINKSLEEVVLDIIVSTGIVSNMTTTENDYYFNSSIAHCVYYGATLTKGGHKHLHGEVVSLGVLCLLTYDKQFELRDKIMEFNYKLGLPVCFDDIDVTEDEFDVIVNKAVTTTEWAHRPEGVTAELYKQCLIDQNEAGRAFKASKK